MVLERQLSFLASNGCMVYPKRAHGAKTVPKTIRNRKCDVTMRCLLGLHDFFFLFDVDVIYAFM